LEQETRGEEEEEQEEEKEDTAQAQKRRKVEPKGGGGALPAVDGALSLAFPSFGTGVFQYDLERAAQGTSFHPPSFTNVVAALTSPSSPSSPSSLRALLPRTNSDLQGTHPR
jgi:hypothetical protein